MKMPAFLFILCLAAGCSQARQAADTSASPDVKLSRKSISNLEMDAIINTDMPDQKISIGATIRLAGYDSLRMNFLGPFGIAAGILYSDTSVFSFYNVFENKAFTGRPTRENLGRAINIALSFGELAKLLRSEVPGNAGDFKFMEIKEDGSLYRNTSKKDVAEFIVFDSARSSITRYQQKSPSGELLLNIYFSDFKETEGEHFARRIEMVFPQLEGNVVITINEMEKKDAFRSEFRFKIPSDAELLEFN